MCSPKLAVTPSDCALAVGVPLFRETFLAQLADHENFDFARTMVGTGDPSFWWDRVYSPIVEVQNRICREMQALGVTVVQQARRADLIALFAKHRVVTLATHWHMSSISPDDIVDPMGMTLMLNKRDKTDSLGRAWTDFLGACGSQLPPDVNELRAALAAWLRTLADTANAAYNPRSATGGSPDADWSLTRPALERTLAGALKPARVVELIDGLQSLGEFIQCIPRNSNCIIDLSICRSALAFELIKYQRPECLLVVNRFPVHPIPRFLRYSLIMKLLARSPLPFLEAATAVHSGEVIFDEETSTSCRRSQRGTRPIRRQ